MVKPPTIHWKHIVFADRYCKYVEISWDLFNSSQFSIKNQGVPCIMWKTHNFRQNWQYPNVIWFSGLPKRSLILEFVQISNNKVTMTTPPPYWGYNLSSVLFPSSAHLGPGGHSDRHRRLFGAPEEAARMATRQGRRGYGRNRTRGEMGWHDSCCGICLD